MVRGKIGQKYRKTCVFDLILTSFAPNPPDLLLAYFLPYFGVSGPLARPPFHNACAMMYDVLLQRSYWRFSSGAY